MLMNLSSKIKVTISISDNATGRSKRDKINGTGRPGTGNGRAMSEEYPIVVLLLAIITNVAVLTAKLLPGWVARLQDSCRI